MSVMEGIKDTHNGIVPELLTKDNYETWKTLTKNTPNGIVQELLTKDNYETWKTLMKNYLVGKNLWSVVESGSVSTRVARARRMRRTAKTRRMDADVDARRMDAEALHIIQISCGPKILDEIRKNNNHTAKDTWNFLAWRYFSEERAKPDIEQGIVDDTIVDYRDLCKYVERGDWIKIESSLKVNREFLLKNSESDGRTILHIATMAGHEKIVKRLVDMGEERLVEMKDDKGYTALALAAHYTGNVDVATHMVEKGGDNVLTMRTEHNYTPLVLAASKGHKQLTRYLYKKTPTNFLGGPDPRDRVLLLKRCIKAEIFDVALRLLESYTDLPAESISDPEGFVALRALAQMPSAFLSGSKFGFLRRFIYDILRVEKKCQDSYCFIGTGIVPGNGNYMADSSGRFFRRVLNILLWPVRLLGWLLEEIVYLFVQFFKLLNLFGIREIYEQKCTHDDVRHILRFLQLSVANFKNSELHQASVYDAMLDAAKHGIVEFINAMTEANHDLLWAIDSRKRGIFSYAVLYRKKNVFQLIHTLNGRKDIIKSREDIFGNNLLHLAGHLGPSSDLNRRPGAALQMQREIHWFKAVEEVVHPKCKEARNDDDKKPQELFTEMHKQLVRDGEKWAKEASNSFILVGILITTVMFAAAFTVPGGNDQVTGVPILLNERIFTAFVVADAVSLFTSATSVLIFIGILTSRYAEKDFQIRLPCKLLAGLFFLFLSVVFMVVAFCSALAIVVNKYWAYKRLFIGGASLGCFPVIVLVPSQLILMYEILRSTLSNPIRRKIK